MAIPVILSRNGQTVYPATIPDAIIDPNTGSPVDLNAGITAQEKSDIITSAVAAVPPVTSVASAGIASGVTDTVKNDIIASASAAAAGNNTPVGYTGPFAASIANEYVSVNSGVLYLGGTESTIPSTSVASANGTLYFYMYYNNGSYSSGFEIAASANALTNAASITGSAGYYTAIASVNNNMVTQYQYGNISINGRLQ
jgi:hypothetical protein